MSRLDKLLAGWTFRTATPTFEAGEEITAYVTHRDDDGYSVRIGDSVLRIDDAEGLEIETKVRVRVTSFDDATYEGTGEVVDVLGTDV
ncbi:MULTISPECIES: hypothetical protein [Haloferax]|uniref:DUF7513 domain-containing protein n=1 Tax=Haloferax marinum TaxID=2666143 RepID=A0A6A8G494_9EURY|nr:MULTISPECIES: hypothetical protein [Haloferax]KAB1196385.1 hypothetical protein Hfx1150_02165 [Haloferax sp. CBA1150]MRW95378.1 hypothetical protein [Haloferax marinum]